MEITEGMGCCKRLSGEHHSIFFLVPLSSGSGTDSPKMLRLNAPSVAFCACDCQNERGLIS
jgi:hypothetical protein